jgi:hypothetical protein
MPDLIIFIVCLIAIVGLSTYTIILQKKYFNLVKVCARVMMDIDVLQNELKIANNIYANDDFIKFISQSRDAAYKYIEEVQEALKDFVEKADHIIRDSDVSPNTVLSYKKLIEMLPKENKDA